MNARCPESSRHLLAWAGDVIRRARALSAACRVAFHALVLFAAAVAWCWIFGLPSRATRLLAAHLGDGQHAVTIRRVRIDPLAGIRASGLTLVQRSDTNRAPPLQADDVTIRLNWHNVIGGGPWLRALELRGGTARLLLPPDFARADGSRDFAVSNITARFSIAWDLFRVEQLEGSWPGGRIHIAGQVLNRSASTNKGSLWQDWLRVQNALDAAPEPIRELYRHLASVEPREPIDLAVAFRHHSQRTELSYVTLDAKGGRAICRGLEVEGWKLHADLDAKRCDLPEVMLSASGRICRIEATLDLTNRTMRAHAVNELPPDYWESLLPASWASGLSRQAIALKGPIRTEFWLDTTPWTEAGTAWRGHFAWAAAEFRGIRLVDAALDVVRDPHRIVVTNATVRVEVDGRGGPLAGDLSVDLASGNMDCNFRAAFDPHLLAPVMSRGSLHFLERIQFAENEPPRFDGGFAVRGTSNEHVTVHGRLQARDLVYHDVPLLDLHTVLTYSNDCLRLDEFRFSRTNGIAVGWLDLDLRHEIYAFDLCGNTDPRSVGLIVSSNLFHALDVGHYDGIANMHAWGVYNTLQPAGTELRVDVDATQVGIQRLTADRARFLLENRGNRYATTNILASVAGGEVTGRFFVYPGAGTNDGERFELDAALRKADLPRFARLIATSTNIPPSGQVSLDLTLAGRLDKLDLAGLRGEGRLAITNGQLHKARLFGGLSSLLSRLSPDLGYAAQTELDLPFKVADGKLNSPKVLLGGEWLSVKGKGAYNLETAQLDYLIEAQLLKKGLMANAVRIITLPVTKLFQIELKGTLDKPEWRTANLPGIF